KQKGAHENLTQLGVGLDQIEKFVAVDLEYFARFAHPQRHRRATAGEHRNLAGELSGVKRSDPDVAIVPRLDAFNGAGHYHIEMGDRVASAREHSPRLDVLR